MTSSSRKVRRVSDNVKLGKLIIWLWISCILMSVVSSQDNFYTNGRFGKRKETRSLQFQTGSRFGRSYAKNSRDGPKRFEIEPRMDHFFMGSRYGKRSSSPPSATAMLAGENHEIGPAALSLKRFEAAIDYLDRMRQAEAVRQDLSEQLADQQQDDYQTRREDGDEEPGYRPLCDGHSKICVMTL